MAIWSLKVGMACARMLAAAKAVPILLMWMFMLGMFTVTIRLTVRHNPSGYEEETIVELPGWYD